jgi:molecular chaperone Hsp33
MIQIPNAAPSTDRLLRVFSRSKHVAFTFVDVTQTAKELERRHLCGPCAGKVLGEALVAVALASTTIKNPGECVSFQLKTDGPVGGALVEATAEGTLRGFTYQKVLNEFDAEDDMDLASAMGKAGMLTVIRSSGQTVLYSGVTKAAPPNIQQNLAKHFNESIQIPAAVDIAAKVEGGYLAFARGLLVEKLHDCATEDFVRVLELVNRGDTRAALAKGRLPEALSEVVGLDDLEVLDEKSLSFACRCSQEKTLAAMALMSRDELQGILDSGHDQEVTCHFCGKDYVVTMEEVVGILGSMES